MVSNIRLIRNDIYHTFQEGSLPALFDCIKDIYEFTFLSERPSYIDDLLTDNEAHEIFESKLIDSLSTVGDSYLYSSSLQEGSPTLLSMATALDGASLPLKLLNHIHHLVTLLKLHESVLYLTNPLNLISTSQGKTKEEVGAVLTQHLDDLTLLNLYYSDPYDLSVESKRALVDALVALPTQSYLKPASSNLLLEIKNYELTTTPNSFIYVSSEILSDVKSSLSTMINKYLIYTDLVSDSDQQPFYQIAYDSLGIGVNDCLTLVNTVISNLMITTQGIPSGGADTSNLITLCREILESIRSLMLIRGFDEIKLRLDSYLIDFTKASQKLSRPSTYLSEINSSVVAAISDETLLTGDSLAQLLISLDTFLNSTTATSTLGLTVEDTLNAQNKTLVDYGKLTSSTSDSSTLYATTITVRSQKITTSISSSEVSLEANYLRSTNEAASYRGTISSIEQLMDSLPTELSYLLDKLSVALSAMNSLLTSILKVVCSVKEAICLLEKAKDLVSKVITLFTDKESASARVLALLALVNTSIINHTQNLANTVLDSNKGIITPYLIKKAKENQSQIIAQYPEAERSSKLAAFNTAVITSAAEFTENFKLSTVAGLADGYLAEVQAMNATALALINSLKPEKSTCTFDLPTLGLGIFILPKIRRGLKLKPLYLNKSQRRNGC